MAPTEARRIVLLYDFAQPILGGDVGMCVFSYAGEHLGYLGVPRPPKYVEYWPS